MSLTNVRDTSYMAYHNEVKPTLSERQRMVYNALLEAQKNPRTPNITNSELAAMLNWPINCITPRVYELRNLGKVVEDCKRTCRITGRTAYAWRTVFQETLF